MIAAALLSCIAGVGAGLHGSSWDLCTDGRGLPNPITAGAFCLNVPALKCAVRADSSILCVCGNEQTRVLLRLGTQSGAVPRAVCSAFGAEDVADES